MQPMFPYTCVLQYVIYMVLLAHTATNMQAKQRHVRKAVGSRSHWSTVWTWMPCTCYLKWLIDMPERLLRVGSMLYGVNGLVYR